MCSQPLHTVNRICSPWRTFLRDNNNCHTIWQGLSTGQRNRIYLAIRWIIIPELYCIRIVSIPKLPKFNVCITSSYIYSSLLINENEYTNWLQCHISCYSGPIFFPPYEYEFLTKTNAVEFEIPSSVFLLTTVTSYRFGLPQTGYNQYILQVPPRPYIECYPLADDAFLVCTN